jgi:NitT/TauT family transport system substrate-binding protein
MIRLISSAALLSLAAAPAIAQDLTPVTFATNWLAQAEHGGYYQAIADGTYEEYGLDVTIMQGGPQSPGRPLLVSGQVQFYMGGVTGAVNAVKEEIPTITLAAIFQKDPQILMAHPDAGFDTFADLANASKIIMSADGFTSYYTWMKAEWPEFVDEKYEPYQFNPASFLADPMAVQQGYLTSEPYSIETQAGFAPVVYLLADQGYDPYSTTIEAMRPWVEENPETAQAFVEASIIGWYNYLYGDNSAANELIKTDNPEMTDEQLAYSLEKMMEYGIVVSDAAETDGIGCMTDERWTSYYDRMVEVGLYEAGIDVSQAYTTEYVCKGVGMDLMN